MKTGLTLLAWHWVSMILREVCSMSMSFQHPVYKWATLMFHLLLLVGCWKKESLTCGCILWWVGDCRAAALEWGSGEYKGQQVAHSPSSCMLFQERCKLQQVVLWCYCCVLRVMYCTVLYLCIYKAPLAVHTNQRHNQCDRPKERKQS